MSSLEGSSNCLGPHHFFCVLHDEHNTLYSSEVASLYFTKTQIAFPAGLFKQCHVMLQAKADNTMKKMIEKDVAAQNAGGHDGQSSSRSFK